MAVVHPRNRTVYFRISEDEFQQLVELSKRAGAGRSVSELSREAVRQLILNEDAADDRCSSVQSVFLHFDRKIQELSDRLDEVLLWMRRREPAAGGATFCSLLEEEESLRTSK